MSTHTQSVRGPLRFPAPARRLLAGCLLLLLLPAGCRQQPRVRVVIRETAPLLDIAAREMAARLEQSGYKVEIATGHGANAGQVNAIIFTVDASTPALQPEGFRIIPLRASGFFLFRVIGYDSRGVLWGGQELAEQIVSSGRLETVGEQTANRLFPLRAVSLPLPLPENSVSPQAKTEARDHWRERFDLLSRDRYNSIFFETTAPLTHFVNFPDRPGSPASSAQEVKPNMDWLRDLFRMAQERGLDAYLQLTKASLEELLVQDVSPPGAAEHAPAQPPDRSNRLAEALPALLRSYPELAGVALEKDVLTLSETPERVRLVAEKFLAPLTEIQERRPIFLSVDRDWWPSKEEWGQMPLSSTVHFLAPLSMLGEAQREPGYAVLWRLDAPPSPLRPWEDPAAVRETLQKMGEKNSLGFLDESWKSPQTNSLEVTTGQHGPPPVEEDWFRLLLWGRMGYSTNVSDQYWEQPFAARFGSMAGPAVYAAAAHSSKALSLLQGSAEDSRPSPETGVRTENIPAAAKEFLFAKSYLLQLPSGRSSSNFITEVLSEKKLLLPSEEKQRAGFLPPETLEEEAQQALSEAAKAARYGAWKGAANENFYRRIQHVAGTGFALAENFRAAQALARFLLDGEENNRRQALQHWQQAQQALAAGTAQNLPGDFRALSSLRLQLSQAMEITPQLRPWRWEKATWEVGTVEGWQPALPTDVPIPQKWLPAQTSWLSEFGPYGQQPWRSALNQQLRSAFLLAPGELSLTPASLLVGRTRLPVRETGRLVLAWSPTSPPQSG
ncbi:MAG: hypothetical protein A3J28_08350 [Acidobacteria bacterium RIFCSPLOWO2_12_FULL_60_22]|nr:MAG: hypothetical protein A3J28_08350 [Acidobacteria bacterium RIFCSPLOWO2_12_FULL_60_22]